jgi:hypothetical protein
MYKNFITAIVLSSGALVWASAASAVTTISIGDCLGAACAPTTIASGSGSVAVAGSPLGASWTITASATGSPPLAPTTLDSNTISVQAASGGTAKIVVTQQGNTSPLGINTYLSSMSVNPGTTSPAGFTIVESTFDDPNNGLFTTTHTLSTDTFNAIRADGPFANLSANDLNPFSVTDFYLITAPAGCSAAVPCSFNLTINLSSVAAAVPEPASLTIIGSALVGLGWFGRRRRMAS